MINRKRNHPFSNPLLRFFNF